MVQLQHITICCASPSVASQFLYHSILFQGFGRLSLVAASAAQSAAGVVQVGTKEIQSKVCQLPVSYCTIQLN
jgi:hypothetical protein